MGPKGRTKIRSENGIVNGFKDMKIGCVQNRKTEVKYNCEGYGITFDEMSS
jgi:hypothetical protein